MRIRREHDMSREEARSLVEEIADRLNQNLRLQREWDGYDLRVRGSGVNGKISVAIDFIEVDVKLGFALMMLEPTIRREIESTMDEHLS